MAGRSRNPSPGKHDRTAHPSQQWRGTSRARTHTPQQPSEEWGGAAEIRAQAHTFTPHTPARNGGVQVRCAHKHTHTPIPQPGVAGRSGSPSPNTHTHTAHPSKSGGVQAERAHKHAQPNIPASQLSKHTGVLEEHTRVCIYAMDHECPKTYSRVLDARRVCTIPTDLLG